MTDCPVAGGVLGEGEAKQGSTLLVELDRPDLPPMLVPGTHVDVPQWRFTQRSAVSGLLAHPLNDLISQVATVELSDAAHDAMQEHPARRLVDVLAGGHQPHTGFLEGPVYLHIVRSVPCQPVELVDDDVVNPTIFLKVGQHLLQLRPVRRPSRLTAVGELLDDQRAHRLGLTLIRLPLSRQGEALLRPTTLGLLPGGDADV